MSDQKTPQTGNNVNSPTMGVPKHLVVLSQIAPSAGKIFRLHKDRIVIGSVVSADIQLQGEGIAPIHAVIEITSHGAGPQATIYDLASPTGVYINGSKHVTAQIKTGDEITVGRFRLKFAVEDPQSQKVSARVQETGEGRKLFMPEQEQLQPLITNDDRGVEEIFDYRPTSKTALEGVMSWSNTILDIEHFVEEGDVTIGDDRNNDFPMPFTGNTSAYAIATRSGDGYTLHLEPRMSGVVQRQGQMLSLDQIRSMTGGSTLNLGKNEFAKISIGEIDFYFSYTAAPPRLKSRKILERDPFMGKIMLTSLALTGAMIAGVLNMDPPKQIEVEELPERLATILYQPEKYPPRPKPPEPKTPAVEAPETPKAKEPEPKKTVKIEVTPTKEKLKVIPKTINTAEQKQPKAAAQRKQDEAKEGAGAKAKGEAGQRGSKTAAPGKTPQEAAKRPSPQGGTGKGGGNSEVQDQGNVDLLKGAASTITNILGNTAAKLGSGGSELKGFGNFSTLGKGGQALSGSGKGGGGDAEGLGGLADRGRGGGRVGTGMGAAGNGSGIIGGSSRVQLRVGGAEETVVMGSIDKAAIAAAIEAHKDEFRLCYEREINAENPNLSGTVKTSFVIGSSGRVTEAGIENSTIKNNNIERCVLTVLRRIDFPIPVGGGVVQVGYPFKYDKGR
jgi:outer membrane biosynthesis protein TonB/pSer/pThr/pTyr-binding forkhead associated (FHA) protein